MNTARPSWVLVFSSFGLFLKYNPLTYPPALVNIEENTNHAIIPSRCGGFCLMGGECGVISHQPAIEYVCVQKVSVALSLS